MLRTNEDKLVKISVLGEVSHPIKSRTRPYLVSFKGEIYALPGVGGITYNKRVGDNCVDLMGDHVEPGVSVKNTQKDPYGKDGYNTALNVLSCIGNEAIIVSGDAKGEKGVVVGKHGGIEHVIVDFKPEIMERLLPGDKILIKAFGQGLKLLDYPDIKVMNIDPNILKKFPIKEENGKLKVGVAKMIPAKIMGSGLGADHVYSGDYDIQLFDEDTIKEYGLKDLRFGDVVAIIDADHTFGRIYKKGAVSIGVVVHSWCYIAGHGPGVTTILTTSKQGVIEPYIDTKANLKFILGL